MKWREDYQRVIIFSVFTGAIFFCAAFFVWSKIIASSNIPESRLSVQSLQQGSFFVQENKFDGNSEYKSTDKFLENKEISTSKQVVKLLFVGDMMFDRYIRQVAQKKGNDFILKDLEDFLKQQDAVIGNLEGPITDNESVSINSQIGEPRHFKFTFQPDWAQILADKNIRIVNLGNNHILNFGEAGFGKTQEYLEQSRVEWFGDVSAKICETGADCPDKSLIKELNGQRIGFVNFNQFTENSVMQTLASIKQLRSDADVVIVYTHWGTEYQPVAGEKIKDLAHQFIDAGADSIIGTHPHVVQNKEVYKGKTIYYSLGNFVFDQYFSPETKQGLGVQLMINPEGEIGYKDIKFELETSGKTRAFN